MSTRSFISLTAAIAGGFALGGTAMLPAAQPYEFVASVVAGGALVAQGMPRFEEMTQQTREDLRQYLRSLAAAARQVAE